MPQSGVLIMVKSLNRGNLVRVKYENKNTQMTQVLILLSNDAKLKYNKNYHTERKNRPLQDRMVQTNSLYGVFEIGLVSFGYNLLLMSTPVLLASVNSVNSSHIGS